MSTFALLLSSMLCIDVDHSFCGTSITAEQYQEFVDRQLAGVYDEPVPLLSGVITVYVKAHVMESSSGTGGLTDAQVRDSIDALNTGFDGYGFRFQLLDEITRIQNSAWLDLDYFDDAPAVVAQYPQVDYAVNLYYASQLGPCGYATTTSPGFPIRMVALKNSCVSGGRVRTITHELGHYFDLLHTHADGNPQECVDGSNCQVAADFVCDTPADPDLTFTPITYPICQVSPHPSWPEPCGGATWNPDPTLVMSYAGLSSFNGDLCTTVFTPGQQERMYNSVVNLQREITDLDPAACCLPGGACAVLGNPECNIAGGTYSGIGSVCDDSTCSRGSCCFENGFCFPQVEQALCEAQGGAFYGPGVTCPPQPCDSADLGTCCLLDGTCGSALPADCVSNGGDWLGFDSSCADSPCESLDVACCFPNQCLELTADSCLASGGTLEAIGGCTDAVCDPKACCLTGGVCVDLLRSTCVASGGSPESNAVCDTTQCQAPACPGDVDGDGQVAFGDLLATLSVWGPCIDCPEDFDGDDAVTFDDLIGLLSVWGDC